MLRKHPMNDSTHCRRRNQPSATHTFLQVVQGLCVDAPETTCDQQTFEPPLFDMIFVGIKNSKTHDGCQKLSFWILSAVSILLERKKSPHPAKHNAKCPSGQHWRDFDDRSHMENPGFCLQDWQKISKEMKPSRSSWNLSLTPPSKIDWSPSWSKASGGKFRCSANQERICRAMPWWGSKHGCALKIWGRSRKINENNL